MWCPFRIANLFCLAWAACIMTMQAFPAARAEPVVTGVRLGLQAAMTRLVIEVTERVDYRIFALADPYRVVIDLPHVEWHLSSRAPPAAIGLITGLRYGRFRPGTARVVLDVGAPVAVSKTFVMEPVNGKPWRLVIDLVGTNRKAFLAALRKPPALRAPPPKAAPLSPKLRRPPRKRIVAIDPGHGGIDPGTKGVEGIWEKHITLAHAKELRRQLLATGRYRVVLTRKSDTFVRLRERIARIRAAGAELFVSLHADSIKDSAIRGASVYTLSEKASDREAAALAAKENKADVIAGIDLSARNPEVVNILIDLAQRETMNASAVFARLVVTQIGSERRLLRNNHRFAGFAVLKAPDVPSVLVEMGYLSNRRDAASLRQPRGRARLVAAIRRAVDAYFAREQALNRP